MSDLDRRTFMITAGGSALALAASPARVRAQGAGVAVRRAVGQMQSDNPALASYRLAVERMKALPASDPRNWNRIAQTHVDFCPHGNWFFLPWHRAYVVAFERLCRQLSGDPNFVLPYWDWTAQRQLPPAFTAPTVAGRRNALFDATRDMGPGDQVRTSAVGERVIARLMAETSFELFGSTRPGGQNSTEARWQRARGRTTALEAGPHNTVHEAVGGDMARMISPRDPIFWLHHANVDRLWARWNALGGRNPSNPLWTQFRFANAFVQPRGQGTMPWNAGVADVLDHRAIGYTYPDLPEAGRSDTLAQTQDPREARVLATKAVTGTARINTVLATRFSLAPGAVAALSQVSQSGSDDANAILHELPKRVPAAAAPDARTFSILDGIGSASGEAVVVNVFLNSPNAAAAADNDPHFVATFGLFGLQSHAAHGGLSVEVELTETIARLKQVQDLGTEVEVQLVPVEARGEGLELKLDHIDLVTR